MVAKGEGGRMEWEFGVSRCKLLHIESLNNKILLYNTENYIQYPVISHNGNEYEEEYIYVCVYIYIYIYIYICISESLCCTTEINTTL